MNPEYLIVLTNIFGGFAYRKVFTYCETNKAYYHSNSYLSLKDYLTYKEHLVACNTLEDVGDWFVREGVLNSET